MTTARTLVERSLRLIRVTASEETPSAAEITDGLASFNDMVSGFESQGIKLGFADIALDDDLPLEERFHEAIKYLLGVRMASEYGTDISPEVAIIAQNGLSFLQTHFTDIPKLRMDKGLRNRRSRFGGDRGING